MVSVLTPREKRVIQLRHGLIDGHERSAEQVASRFGVTKTRIEQIEAEAIGKLRELGPNADLRPHIT